VQVVLEAPGPVEAMMSSGDDTSLTVVPRGTKKVTPVAYVRIVGDGGKQVCGVLNVNTETGALSVRMLNAEATAFDFDKPTDSPIQPGTGPDHHVHSLIDSDPDRGHVDANQTDPVSHPPISGNE